MKVTNEAATISNGLISRQMYSTRLRRTVILNHDATKKSIDYIGDGVKLDLYDSKLSLEVILGA